MKEIVAILSHCDTDEQTGILIECIDSIKKQGYDIILSSHIDVDSNIKDTVDYFIYDNENPLLTEKDYEKYPDCTVYQYSEYPGYYQQYICFYHGYAVLKLIKNACGVADINGYEIVHFVNYDYIIKNTHLLYSHRAILEKNDIASYSNGDDMEVISTGFFSVKLNKFIQRVKTIKNKEDYCAFSHSNKIGYFETFLYLLCKDTKIYQIFSISELTIENEINKCNIWNKGNPSRDNGAFCHIWLSKIEQDNYIWIWIQDVESTTIEFKIKNSFYKLKPSLLRSHLIKLNDEELESGIEIFLPEYNWSYLFNKDTNKARGRITDLNQLSIYSLTEFIETYKVEN